MQEWKWDEIPDELDAIKEGVNNLVAFRAYESENVNGKPYIAVKFALPESVQSAIENNNTDDDGNLSVYPHATINIYYETDTGARQLKQMLKKMFGEENLKHLIDNRTICIMIEKKRPEVIAETYKNGDYTNIRSFSFKSINEPEKPVTERTSAVKRQKRAVPDVTPTQEEKTRAVQAETEEAEDDDLPF